MMKRGYLGLFFVILNANNIESSTDTLGSSSEWLEEVKYQLELTKSTKNDPCILSDSLTSGQGNTIGKDTFNFALPGMSRISPTEQLKL